MKPLFFVLLLSISQLLTAQTGNLTINIDGIRNAEGRILIFLYDEAQNYLDEEQALKACQIEVTGETSSITLKDLPYGEYSVSLFHDENKDAICNMNFIGIPKEGYAFSRNYVPSFRAPKFEETKFKLDENVSLKVSVIYM